ncbi:MAG: amidase [Chloroflexi bacterium]|nr:amidase [Chloroflexota bacterium]
MRDNELAFASAVDLHRLLIGKKLSPVELTELFLRRIEALNPRLNAYLTVVAEQALADARKAEEAIRKGNVLSLLHGVPVSVKDLFSTRGIRTTAGSGAFADFVPAQDAIAVERLRNAGAILLGKTNTSEFGLSATTENSLRNPCRNPWNLRRTSGGSSGGAAASVAAGLGPLALGSDGGGSIRIPASFCGVYGIKPTRGRVPRSGGIGRPAWEPFGQPGPLSRTVEDAALLLQVIAGPDSRDAGCLKEAPPDYLGGVHQGVKELRLAWSPDLGYAAVDPEVSLIAREAAQTFAELGATVESSPFQLEEPFPPFWTIFTANAFAAYGGLLEERSDQLGPFTVMTLEYGREVTGADYSRALAMMQRLELKVAELLERYDLLLTPTTAVPAFPVGIRPEEIGGSRVEPLWGFLPFTFPFNMTGNPAASIPCGFSKEGLPIGLQIVGRRGDEMSVLRASAAFEQANPWAHHRPPGLPV